jgi:hypothetical protein
MHDMRSVLLPVHSNPQPHPNILSGGDCAYCCLSGIMNTTVLEAYEYVDRYRLISNGTMEKERRSLSNSCMRKLAEVWNKSQTSQVTPKLDAKELCGNIWECKQPWGAPSWEMTGSWSDKVYEILKKDYTLMASIDFEGRGPRFKDRETNHAVLIIGLKDVMRRIDDNCSAIDTILTISCSVRGMWTCEVSEFLFKYGGFNSVPFILKASEL